MKIYVDRSDFSFGIVNFEYKPNENEIEVSEEKFKELQNKILNGYIPTYSIVNNELNITYTYNTEQALDKLRAERTRLLEAFDKWEKAVLRGRETDDPNVMKWYQDLKDLVTNAFENIPTAIQYYIY